MPSKPYSRRKAQIKSSRYGRVIHFYPQVFHKRIRLSPLPTRPFSLIRFAVNVFSWER
jgi:hypothetical protein